MSGAKFWQRRDRMTRQYKLPSCGWLYQDGQLPEGLATMSSIRGENEEILAGAGEGRQALPVLRNVMEQLVDTGKLPYKDLLFSDWHALLMNLFAFSYGSDMHLNVRCPHCKEFPPQPHAIDLANQPCVIYDDVPEMIQGLEGTQEEDEGELEETKILIREPFRTAPLPPYGDIVSFKLLRLKDHIAAESYYEKGLKAGKPGEFIRSYAMAKQIISIKPKDGPEEEVSLMEAMDYIRHGADGQTLLALRQEFSKVEPGYNMFTTLTCPYPKCKASFQIRIPEDGSFFRQGGSKSRKHKETALCDDEP